MRRKRIVVTSCLAIAVLASLGFIAAYVVNLSAHVQGVLFACAAFALGAALVFGVAWLLPPEQVIDHHEPLREDRIAFPRLNALARFGAIAAGVFGLAALVPFVALAPEENGALMHTKWRRGSRLRREDGRFAAVDDLTTDEMVTVFPENAPEDPQSQTLLIRLPGSSGRGVDGYVAFSKLCTHAGCPVALYRAREKQLLCPCHQSVFDVMRGGRVISGPADHALPELPLEIDTSGYIRAAGDFPTPVGPGFWGRA